MTVAGVKDCASVCRIVVSLPSPIPARRLSTYRTGVNTTWIPKPGSVQVLADALVCYIACLFADLSCGAAFFRNIGHRFVTGDARSPKRRFETYFRFVFVVEFGLLVVQCSFIQV
jgi:F0F1-type ATP synthase membrane subunit c/vacuolar-type H+-ATPase subunit K